MHELLIQSLSVAIAGVAVVYFISGVDEMIIDIVYVIWRVFRRLVFLPRHPPLQERQLMLEPEKPAAIMVPAWQEAGVIGAMLERNLQQVRYAAYHILVGVYPNDTATQDAVRAVALRHRNIHMIVVDHDGPTNKADCLNAVLAAVPALERQLDLRFEIFVMNDAEDIIPPLELKVLNHLIPRKDIVQLPVFPLPARWIDFTAGHYMDEFAHQHLRDMRVREWLTGSIPTAGVGCGFSRRCIDLALQQGAGQAFSTSSVTEDYEFSLKLANAGLQEIFFDSIVEREGPGPYRWADKLPAVTEAFPRTFWTAVRQKTRWIMGITLQGWEHLGWRSGLAGCYMLFRDRKVLVNSFAVMFGYLLVAAALLLWAVRAIVHDDPAFPDLVPRDSWVWWVLALNTIFMLVQLGTRAAAVLAIYGPWHALLSAPRAVWGNVINATATFRAILIYLTARHRRVVPAWDKTHHQYPQAADAD